jgi:Mrp family chromosome partitioning ATPase
MLQALKNLEAKAVRAPAQKDAAPANREAASSAAGQKTAAAEPRVTSISAAGAPTIEAVIPRAVEVVDRLNAVVASELADVSSNSAISVVTESFHFGHSDFAFAEPGAERAFGGGDSTAASSTAPTEQPPLETGGESAIASAVVESGPSLSEEPAATSDVRAAQSLPRAVEASAPPSDATTVSKKPLQSASIKAPCALERQVRWLLNDPVRSQPVIELVERLGRDLEQINGKTVAFVTVGTDGALPGPLLPVAVLLAEQLRKRVLLVDGDTARCRLSMGLQCGQNSGLSDLLQGNETHETCCVPTATRDLAFLPAGQSRHYDVSTSGTAFENLLEQLRNQHDCVLVEVGSAGSSNASALARQADATYLVVELGVVETIAARKALNDLRTTGARVLGCIAI